MKPIATLALTVAALIGPSTMAGERPMSFDGVGSMVLDMADEPVQSAEYTPSMTSDNGQCDDAEDAREAFEARVEAMYSDIEHQFRQTEAVYAQFDVKQFADLGLEVAVAASEATSDMQAMKDQAIASASSARQMAMEKARATIEARREQLEMRIVSIDNHHSRMALKRAEKALRIAHDALTH
ncbi:hypothetical protein [Kordiimonas aestuarii]|uniref:hypothetical protein n=1 Tax=Kordiimonas aestuarii TaxID=1005925 RepID=UPI0021CFC7F9|nr:hypothetical protein [Kordiimonas aestuarii]